MTSAGRGVSDRIRRAACCCLVFIGAYMCRLVKGALLTDESKLMF